MQICPLTSCLFKKKYSTSNCHNFLGAYSNKSDVLVKDYLSPSFCGSSGNWPNSKRTYIQYGNDTIFPKNFNPENYGMVFAKTIY